MSQALDVILSDTDSILEVTVEIDSAKRSDGTLKTWYFSTNPRSTGGSEIPANTEFLPFLQPGGVLGPLTQSLAEDLVFSGLAKNSPGTVTLIQQIVDNDQLSVFNDYVFAGYKLRVKVGRVTDLYASFELFRTTTVHIDPIIELTSNGLQAQFQLAGALARVLEEPLEIKQYVGIPTCANVLTTTAVALTSYNAAHDLTSFTVMYKLLVTSNPAANRNLLAKTSSATNNNFSLNYNTSGFVECLASLAGVGTTLHISATNLADSIFHTIVWGLLDKTTSYLMIDGVIVSTATPSATVNLPAAGVRMARFMIGKHCDARIYNRYITPDEARSVSAVRSSGNDLGCVGCWRFDDGGSATVANDYSPTNADATWTGVLNTDYKWDASDLGEPELAGRKYPLLVGNVFNARAHLIDGFREKYRANVDASYFWAGSNVATTIKSQGTVLTLTTDYTISNTDGIFTLVSQEAEPITVDVLNNGTGEESFYPSQLAFNVLTNRTRFTGNDVHNYDPLTLLCPWPSGYWTDQETTAQNFLAEVLGESALHYFEDVDGSLWIDMLTSPVGYGPYEEPCLDLRGGIANRIVWSDIADVTGSVTLACWVKLKLLDQTAYNWGFSEPNQGTLFLIQKGGLSGNYSLYFQAAGADAGKLKFRTAGTTLSSPAGAMPELNTWYFVAGVFDDTANTMKLYVGPKGGTLSEVASGSNTGSQSTNSHSVMVGDSGARFPWMSVQHVQIWGATKTLSDLQALMATPPVGNETNLKFYAPITEGEGDTVLDLVSSTSGDIIGQDPLDPSGASPQWCPKFTIDLDTTPSVKLSDFHHTHPVWNIIASYAKNSYPMEDSDIDSGVSQNARLELKEEWKDVRYENPTRRDRFKSAKKIELNSTIRDLESSTRLMRAILSRFGEDNYVGILNFPSGLNISRLACGMIIGDEIGIISSVPSQLQTKKCFKVVSVSPNPLKLATTLAIWK